MYVLCVVCIFMPRIVCMRSMSRAHAVGSVHIHGVWCVYTAHSVCVLCVVSVYVRRTLCSVHAAVYGVCVLCVV